MEEEQGYGCSQCVENRQNAKGNHQALWSPSQSSGYLVSAPSFCPEGIICTLRKYMLKEGGRMSFQKVSGYNTGHLKRNRKSSQKVNEGFVSNIKQTKISLKRTGLNHSIKIYSFTKCITLKITLLS